MAGVDDVAFFVYQQGVKHYLVDGRYGDFRQSTISAGADRVHVGLAYQGDSPVEIHFGAEIPIAPSEQSYTLIPAVYYNGNNSEPTHSIPAMSRDSGDRFEVSAAACSIPLAMHYDGAGAVTILRGSPFTKAGPSGFVVDRDHLEFVVPAMEKKRYTLIDWLNRGRRGFVMEQGDCLSFTVELTTRPAASILGGFRLLHEAYRPVEGYSDHSRGKLSLAEASELVAERLLQYHHRTNAAGQSYFMNVSELENTPVLRADDFSAEWFQVVGWCGGTMTAYPLLKKGGAFREAALNNIDFMVDTGIAANGLAYSMYDGNDWRWEETLRADSWKHIRPQADFIYYLLKALMYERSMGVDHPAWLDAARRGLDTFCGLWDRCGDFGFRIQKAANPPEMVEGGSCAGAFVLQALTQGMRFFPENDRYRTMYRTACDYYYQQFVVNGHCTSGPLDIYKADDSESAAAMTDAFLQGGLILKDEGLLGMAEDAAAIFASWVVSYAAPFPLGSTLDGINPCGGVIANVQNRHIGPGICTNSGRFLYDLYRATGKDLYRKLYDDILHAAVNFVATADGEFSGYHGGRGQWVPFKRGVVSEQVNLTDSLNQAGEMWNVACSWPATAILLAWAEYPRD